MSTGIAFWTAAAGTPPPPPPPAGPPLDPYTTGLAFAYARKRLLTSWTGALYRVRRTSDNTEQDIAYDPTSGTDTASLTTFVGSSSGYVSKWYDQSGAGLDLLQATTTAQPQVVNAGTVLPNFTCDGSSQSLNSTGSTGSYSAGITVYYVGVPAPVNGTPTPIMWAFGGGAKNMIFAYSGAASNTLPIVNSANCTIDDPGRSDHARAFHVDLSQASVATQFLSRSQGVSQTLANFAGSVDATAFGAGPISYGSNIAGTGNWSPAQFRAYVGYGVVHSTTTMDAINTALT